MRKAFTPFALALALLLLPSGTALAADFETCSAYANHATSQAAQDAVATCGYSGDMWNTIDHLAHLQWCLRTSATTVKAEQDSRQRQIDKCNGCKTYARDAVDAYNFNDPEGRIRGAFDGYEWPPMPCGFTGDAWSDNYDGHLRWCVGASDADAKRETANRKAMTDICWACRQYAHKAYVAYRKTWDRCKSFWSNPQMSGPRWSIDHQHHVRWCLGLAADKRDGFTKNESHQRDIVVAACEAKVAAPLMIQPAAKAETRKKLPAAARQEAKRAATKPVTAARGSADTDAVKASPAKKPSAGSGSSAMDRLGGGPSGAVGGAGAASAGKARSSGGSSAAAPASSGTGGGGGGGVAPPATTINRNAIGGGGSSERVR
jgi:hypothetical protein